MAVVLPPAANVFVQFIDDLVNAPTTTAAGQFPNSILETFNRFGMDANTGIRSGTGKAKSEVLAPLLTSVTRWARLAVRSVPDGTHNGSPGVNPATFDARLLDIPRYARQRIEDFAVCCRLVPTHLSLYPLAVRQPASLP